MFLRYYHYYSLSQTSLKLATSQQTCLQNIAERFLLATVSSNNVAYSMMPLSELLSKNKAWLAIWGRAQQEAFARVKVELIKPTTLTLYDRAKDLKVSADASSFGLGTVLLQKEESESKPVAYASRSMTETERHYAQIKKEALAITRDFEKFSSYILGKSISVETDHKPLVSLSSKHLDTLPVRVLRFRLRLDRFHYVINHVLGKHLYVADTLSRAPLATRSTNDDLEHLAELAARAVIAHIPASTEQLHGCLQRCSVSR